MAARPHAAACHVHRALAGARAQLMGALPAGQSSTLLMGGAPQRPPAPSLAWGPAWYTPGLAGFEGSGFGAGTVSASGMAWACVAGSAGCAWLGRARGKPRVWPLNPDGQGAQGRGAGPAPAAGPGGV